MPEASDEPQIRQRHRLGDRQPAARLHAVAG
jgi:hypothetical protein